MATLNTAIRGAQISLSAEVIAVGSDEIAFIDADGIMKRETVADLATAMAGVGIVASSGVFALDLNELSDTAIDVSADTFVFIDADDNSSKKEAVADFVGAIDGNGLLAGSGILAVQADGATITVGASGIKVSDDSLDDTQLNAGVGSVGQVLTLQTGGTVAWTSKSSIDEDYIQESEILVEDESANCNGATTDFTLGSAPVVSSVQVYLNGLLQQVGTGKDYTLSGTTVSFATAPLTGDILLVHYIAT